MDKSGLNVLFCQWHRDIWWCPLGWILIDEDVVVLAGYDDRSVIGKRYIVALVVFHGALERSQQLSTGTEHCQIEVVVVVGNNHLTMRADTHADRIIRHTLATNDSQWSAVITEHLEITHTTFNASKHCKQFLTTSNFYAVSDQSSLVNFSARHFTTILFHSVEAGLVIYAK